MQELGTKRKMPIMRVRLMLTLFSLSASLTSFAFISYSWFNSKRTSEIQNANGNISEPYKFATAIRVDDVITGTDSYNFNKVYPGAANSRKMSLQFFNNDTRPIKLNWMFLMPTAGKETPFIDTAGTYGNANHHYYFGSQIQLGNMTTNNNGVVTNGGIGQNKFLVTTSSVSVTKGQVNSVATALTFNQDFLIIENILVAAGTNVTTEFYFTFVDNGTNQNVFQRETFISQRTLAVFLTPGDA